MNHDEPLFTVEHLQMHGLQIVWKKNHSISNSDMQKQSLLILKFSPNRTVEGLTHVDVNFDVKELQSGDSFSFLNSRSGNVLGNLTSGFTIV